MNLPVSTSDPLLPIDELGNAITGLCARMNAENYALLTLIRQFDERLGWLPWGFPTCARGCTGAVISALRPPGRRCAWRMR